MVPGLGPGDRTFCEVPVASLAGPLMGIYFPLVFGLVGYIPDADADQGAAMAEASPTFYLGFPRIWEMRASHTLVEIETSSRLHRALFELGMKLRRYWMGDAKAGHASGPLRTLAGLAGYLLIVRPMLDRWGLLRGRFILSGGAPLSPDLVRLWRLWGVTIRELYGSTESSGMCTIQAEEQPEAGTAGCALPQTQIKIADDREILVKGPGVFGGYWKRDEATRDAFAEGWLRTGDIGELREDGNLVVIDRKRDVLRMAGGEEVAASSVEHVLKYSPYIRDALLVGEGKQALGALIEIDPDTVAQWARKESVAYTGFTNLATNERVVRLVQEAIDEANDKLHERGSPVVTRFRILPKELDPEDPSEITATRKIRRRQLAEKFSELVDEMFMTEETARIASHARGAELVSTTEEER
jgi:long-chain acyl-CoA synthetase